MRARLHAHIIDITRVRSTLACMYVQLSIVEKESSILQANCQPANTIANAKPNTTIAQAVYGPTPHAASQATPL